MFSRIRVSERPSSEGGGPVAHDEVLKEKVLGGGYVYGATDEHCCPCSVRVRER